MNKALVTGAGGFIGGHLVRELVELGYDVKAVDKKPVKQWYQINNEARNLALDLSLEPNCRFVCHGIDDVYNLAADMGGMGFIERHRVECMRSVLINTNLIEAAYNAGVERYFFSSSACAYNTLKQDHPDATALKEEDAYPALPERGYGWEKLFSELVCQEYFAERGMNTFIARFHNVYGPFGTWDGGREKAPAAICRKVIEAIDNQTYRINIWGDGSQTRSYMYVADCIIGIMKIINCPALLGTPINLGSSELVSVNELVEMVEGIAQTTLDWNYDRSQPQGVRGRNSDNNLIKQILGWEPNISLVSGLEDTYNWIKRQYDIRRLSGQSG